MNDLNIKMKSLYYRWGHLPMISLTAQVTQVFKYLRLLGEYKITYGLKLTGLSLLAGKAGWAKDDKL